MSGSGVLNVQRLCVGVVSVCSPLPACPVQPCGHGSREAVGVAVAHQQRMVGHNIAWSRRHGWS